MSVCCRRRLVVLTCLALAMVCQRARADDSVHYRRDILPLLSDRCFKCHGPDSATRKAGLRLDQSDAAKAALETGATAIVSGKPTESALIERITSKDPALIMPPSDSGKVLSDSERAILQRWVEQGAQYEKHWAFVPPVRPEVPVVQHRELVRNPIDNFVLAKLEAEKAEPSPPASKERLIRRLYFDFVGLPPSLPEIDAFVADTSPQAYAKLVDRLLSSPHYGERMATEWLDGARFADSNGYQNDFSRNMAPWRDWVIAAFNKHQRYDQFVIEQLAGDLLPNPTLAQRIATGFNRNHRTVTEAGSIEDEWFVENVVDRVETTGTVMLGLTVGCARCHDHKFDPISQKDFYQLFAFFANVNEKGVYTETRGNVPPMVKAVSSEDEKKLAEFDAKIAALDKQLTEQTAAAAAHRPAWLEAVSKMAVPGDLVPAVQIMEKDASTQGRVRVSNAAVIRGDTSVPPTKRDDLFGKVAVFEGKQHLDYPLDFPTAGRPFSWAVWVKPTGAGAILSRMDSARRARGYDLFLFADRKVGMHIIADWPSNALKVLTNRPLPVNEWSHIVATYDGSGKASGVTFYVNGEKQLLDTEIDKLTRSTWTDQPFRIGGRSADSPLNAAVTDVRLFQHPLTTEEAQTVFKSSLREGLAQVRIDGLPAAMLSQLDKFLLALSTDALAVKGRELRHSLETTKDERTKYEAAIPVAMIMEERKEPRETFVLKRGRYDQPDKSLKMQPDVPAALPPLPTGAPKNRLGLGQWLVSPENPLTARVLVNRLWQLHFGLGLVKTPDNLGVQSELPSHPELLDWLATELIQSGWDVQHIQRLIVESYTYQQRSEAPPEVYHRDPDNRLLGRGPRYRLQSEALRDHALAVSGLLVEKIGGPSVMPYQPTGLWSELAGGAHDDYNQGHGDDLYRRSLYTYRKRTVPHPTMASFDAPSWEICQVKRARTNTPLQALALLNDVTYMEAARKLAERMLIEGGSSADAKLTFAFRLATTRPPTADELAVLRASLQKFTERFRQSTATAEQYISHGESARNASLNVADLAAHTAVASIILNMDEAISKD